MATHQGAQSDPRSFTPGPWAVHPVMAWVSVADDIDDKPICELCRSAKDGSEDATFANAHLIASAPRLYSALMQALGIIIEFGDLNGFRNCSDEELGRLVKTVAVEAAEALTQARGGA